MIYINMHPGVYEAFIALLSDISCEFDVFGYEIWDFISDYIYLKS